MSSLEVFGDWSLNFFSDRIYPLLYHDFILSCQTVSQSRRVPAQMEKGGVNETILQHLGTLIHVDVTKIVTLISEFQRPPTPSFFVYLFLLNLQHSFMI